ncbi:MAG: FAD-dependent oxidoreductase, partial [Candidatus Izemoplasmatales bacterium]|nr:FAD-dependent oxidoreductase [Candidatus Izemoplasmatales bacterium]
MNKYDVVVIGGGPAGLAASKSANDNGAKTLLIEREGRLGGILKQCIHDGFGLQRFKERLTGPEYAWKEIVSLPQEIDVKLLTFVSKIFRKNEGFELVLITREGILHVETKNVILATGCRERTSKQISIHGTNPAGVITAGTAQNYINILGEMPTKKCVILGSGDIGLIMARRITLEGGKVLGVYEAKNSPSGLTRNIVQCLNDFNIPLYLNHTVTRVFGIDRLTAVE